MAPKTPSKLAVNLVVPVAHQELRDDLGVLQITGDISCLLGHPRPLACFVIPVIHTLRRPSSMKNRT
jgi:hypothetical protein